MNFVKKILLLAGDVRSKRGLVLALAEAGYDLRACLELEVALTTVRAEWCDLAVIAAGDSPERGFAWVEALRKVQPTVPVLLLVPRLELPAVIRGIRLGSVELLPATRDSGLLLNAVRALLYPESGLWPAKREPAIEGAGEESEASEEPVDWRCAWLQATRECAALATQVERLAHEKAALEAELKVRSQGPLASTPAAQPAERASPPEEAATAAEALWRAESRRWEEEARQLQQNVLQLAQERCHWHAELDRLRERENQLRAYEVRLREWQAQQESDRALWFSANARVHSRAPFADEAVMRAAWDKLQRAAERLEAERADFQDSVRTRENLKAAAANGTVDRGERET